MKKTVDLVKQTIPLNPDITQFRRSSRVAFSEAHTYEGSRSHHDVWEPRHRGWVSCYPMQGMMWRFGEASNGLTCNYFQVIVTCCNSAKCIMISNEGERVICIYIYTCAWTWLQQSIAWRWFSDMLSMNLGKCLIYQTIFPGCYIDYVSSRIYIQLSTCSIYHGGRYLCALYI